VDNTHPVDEEMIIDVSTVPRNFGEVIQVKNSLFLVTKLCLVTQLHESEVPDFTGGSSPL